MQGGGGSSLNRTSASLRAVVDCAAIQRNEVASTNGTHLNDIDDPVGRWIASSQAPRNDGGLLRSAFTMAEILLSLTIIGVVAAITLPSLTGNINERTWNTQRKALYARFSQAMALMPALNGYGTLNDTNDTAAETFVTAGLAKVLKINNICDSEHLKDCGIPTKINKLGGGVISKIPETLVELNPLFNSATSYETGGVINSFSYSQTNTKAAAFETSNGESLVVYYNPNCSILKSNSFSENNVYGNLLQPTMCANFIYDLNGSKGPNTVGKDIGFMTAFYPTDPVLVAPLPLRDMTVTGEYLGRLDTACREQVDFESRSANLDELSSLFVNKSLILGVWRDTYMSNTREGNAYKVVYMHSGTVKNVPEGNHSYNKVICIKR